MRYLVLFFFTGLFFSSCDDGDIVTVELEFDKELDRCDNNTDQFLIYDLITDPSESLSLIIPRNPNTEALFITEIPEATPVELTIDANNVRFLYRTYNSEPTFCDVIDNPEVVITGNYEANDGTVEVWTEVEDFDNDGIPSADEDEDLDGDSDPATNPTDTDGDGIPNYLDQDDDNDNVPTIDEDNDDDGDSNPFTNARDTDGDTVPDYLDKDDDGDMIDTRFEDANGNQNLFDDLDLESPNLNTPRFLDPEATETFEGGALRSNSYTIQFTTNFVINEVDLQIIRYERLFFGSFVNSFTVTN